MGKQVARGQPFPFVVCSLKGSIMARMAVCRECLDDLRWESVMDADGPRPTMTMRERRREHSAHGSRNASGWDRLVFRPDGSYVGALLHHGGK